MALLGPSGSGKTTALRAVAGFVRPVAGRVFRGDRDVTDLPPHRRGIGMVVQQYALFPHMRVEDNVAFGLKARRTAKGEVRERVAAALEMTGTLARLHRELPDVSSLYRTVDAYLTDGHLPKLGVPLVLYDEGADRVVDASGPFRRT